LQVFGVKARINVFLCALGVALLELALIYPAKLLDERIGAFLAIHLAVQSEWVDWIAGTMVRGTIIAAPIAVFLGGYWLLQRRRRNSLLRAGVRQVSDSVVRVIGSKEWTMFHGDAVVKVAVPDAIAAIDKTRGLLRLKEIDAYQDNAIDLGHVIGLEFRRGEKRTIRDRQSFFRKNYPKYRTLAELPYIRLEIATDGKEPILEYFLYADFADGTELETFFSALQRAARKGRRSRMAPTADMLDSLPPQGSKHGYGWI
jgi:hypothetical protein